jgi:hypothetical protein
MHVRYKKGSQSGNQLPIILTKKTERYLKEANLEVSHITIGDFNLILSIRDSVSVEKDHQEAFETWKCILHNELLLQYPILKSDNDA